MPKSKHKPRHFPRKLQRHPFPKSDAASPAKKHRRHHQPSQRTPARPWSPSANLLLLGEGDFSFAHTLYTKQRASFHKLTATCHDSREQLLSKYPQAEGYLGDLERPRAAKAQENGLGDSLVEAGFESGSSNNDDDEEEEEEEDYAATSKRQRRPLPPAQIHYGIDARKLSSYAALKKHRFDYIIFNFPHTGGLSTDVNRQVRANQSLLVDFFSSARSLLMLQNKGGSNGEGGRVMITLFEQEPYTLWNVRDLARHCGYVVERSWKFDWGAWPGYRHARTLGNLQAKVVDHGSLRDADEMEWEGLSNDDGEKLARIGEKRPGKWRGEEREARTYLFSMDQQGGGANSTMGPKKRKKKAEEDTNSD